MNRIKTFSRFYALINQLAGADKEQLVSEFTGGRTTSLREMKKYEYNQMCDRLQGAGCVEDEKELKRWRHIVLASLSQINIVVRGRDWSEVDGYCMQKKIAGKRFAALNTEELKALNRKLNAIKHKKNRKKAFVPVVITSVPITA